MRGRFRVRIISPSASAAKSGGDRMQGLRERLHAFMYTITLQKEIEKQTALIEALEKKMKSEKQFNVQVILNRELREARINLETLMSEKNPEEPI